MGRATILSEKYQSVSNTLNKKLKNLTTGVVERRIQEPAGNEAISRSYDFPINPVTGGQGLYKYGFTTYIDNAVDMTLFMFNHGLIESGQYQDYQSIPAGLYNEREIETTLPYHDYLFKALFNEYNNKTTYIMSAVEYKVIFIFKFENIKDIDLFDNNFFYQGLNAIPAWALKNLAQGEQFMKQQLEVIYGIINTVVETKIMDVADSDKTILFYINPLNLYNNLIIHNSNTIIASQLYIESLVADEIEAEIDPQIVLSASEFKGNLVETVQALNQ